jgi:D-inositol-3-phosphate glycosyltransferase/glycogen(starch) synthase
VGFPPDARLLVFAGRLSRVKGIDVLLRAMPGVLQLHPAARLFVLGVGFPGTGQDAAVDRLVAELDLTDVVHVYHSYLPRERVYQHFQAATACVFPSTFEPFGLVALEAMSFGVPVVLGPGFSRTIAFDGAERTALRLARPDPKELCCALTSILDGDSSVVEAARRGQRHVERNFSWRSTVQSTLDVYQEALACRQAPGTDRSDRNATTTATAPIGGAADRTGGPSRVELPARAGHGAAAALPDGGVPAGPAAP